MTTTETLHESTAPTVSIVIPVYKKEGYLADTLDSILAQTHKNLDIILLNDGSPDGCPTICESYASSDARIRYVDKKNSGVIDTRNMGLGMARGALIIPFDADDIMPADFVATLVQAAQSHPDVTVFAPGARAFGAREGDIMFSSHELPALLYRNGLPNSCAFRKNALNTIPGYNQNMADGLEDWDFWLYFVERDLHIMRVPDTFYFYRVMPGSRNNMPAGTRNRLKRQLICNHPQLYAAWRPHTAIIWLYPLSKLFQLFGLDKQKLKLAKFMRNGLRKN